ncbi:hypothetical protein PVAP13_3NG076940 [Panicum virgatum]|uniref:Uncharacterized protein n=1 Tax=Panicum virgatum TaxID=38727 RepID=A0A8T0UBI7_PANVG|nr:hypothetical protein PVAP13_3NG076940 [Panicum virgatum]
MSVGKRESCGQRCCHRSSHGILTAVSPLSQPVAVGACTEWLSCWR